MPEQPPPTPANPDPYGRTPADLAAIRRKQRIIGILLGAFVVLGLTLGVVLSIVL